MKTDLLDIYSDYLISQNHYATATGLAAIFDGEISHDQVSRLLRSGEFGSKDLTKMAQQEYFISYLMIYPFMLAACMKSTKKRWRIEEFHKSIKQNASLSKSPTKTIKTQCNHLFALMIAYCKLELLKVKTSLNHFAIKQKLLLKANQIMFKELQLLKASA